MNQDVQALRGIAILMVLLQHFRGRLPTSHGLNTIFENFAFWGGVDLFFVISGYVIALSLFNSTEVGVSGQLSTAGFRSFMVRRCKRLIPASWFWLGAFLVLLVISPELSTTEIKFSTFFGILSGMFGVANFYWSYCGTSGFLNTLCTSPDVAGVYWSLGLEEQFYLLLAASLMVLPITRVITVFVAGALVLSFYQIYISEVQFLSLGWVLRPQGLVIGVLLAILFREKRLEWLRYLPKPLIGGLVSILILALCWIPTHMSLSLSISALALTSGIIVALESTSKVY